MVDYPSSSFVYLTISHIIKSTESVRTFSSCVRTKALFKLCCVVSNGSKTYFLYDITEYFKNEGVCYGD